MIRKRIFRIFFMIPMVLIFYEIDSFANAKEQSQEETTFERQKRVFSSSIEGVQRLNFGKSQNHFFWIEDYQKAVATSKELQKPILLAFMGVSWCPWSKKLQAEILNDEGFIKQLYEKMVLTWLDYPELSGERPLSDEMNSLKERYHIQEFPCLVLIDPSGEEISKVGFVPLSPQEFAQHLLRTVAIYRELKDSLDCCDLKNLSSEEIQILYQKAQKLGAQHYIDLLLEVGLKVDKGSFFLLERYAKLLKSGKRKLQETQEIRNKLVSRDPKNIKGTQFTLAVLDFQVLANKLKKHENPKTALRPLKDYIKKFGQQDKENLWKINMMMAQFLFSKNQVSDALRYAKASLALAPEGSKLEVSESIDYLNSQLQNDIASTEKDVQSDLKHEDGE